ncbi:Histone transcription regulator 3, partial [Coemansia thaxteri]
RLYDIAESDDDYFLVRQCADKASIERGLKLLLAQLLSMSMSVAHHFALNPVVEYSLQMVESEFVGLATWLATKLGLKLDYAYQAVLEDGGDFAPLDGSIRPLSAIHDLLGERGVCTAASGAFMKQLLSECRLILEKDRDNVNAWDIAAACLRCLYDIRLHGSDALGHVCEHFDMDLKSANSVYLLVEPGLVEAIRNRKGAGLRSDFKTIVDKAGIALGELDVERHPRLSMNVDIIDNYLDGTSMPSFVQIDRALRTSAAEFPDLRLPLKSLVKGGSIPVAFRSLPFVRAAIQHELILVRMRSGATRAVEDYDEIIEDYKLNIALGAEPSEAWCHLGRAYADLADEMLLGTASEITECKYDIASLQRLSLSCAAQANQQLPVLYSSPVSSSGSPSKCLLGATAPEPTGKTNGSVCHAVDVDGSDSDQGEGGNEALRLHVRIKALTGHLLYRIAAKPLSLLAFHVLPSNVLVSDDGSEAGRQWDLGKWGGSCDNNAVQFLSQSLAKRYVVSPPSKRVYALARIMFAQATVLDPANWEWSYMLGKVTAKLGNSLAACALYLKACHSAVAASSKSSGTGASAHSHLLQVGVSATTGISAVHAAIPDAAMDPMYKLLASLTKLVWSSRIVGATAQRFIDALPFSCTPSDDCVRGNPRALETSNPETAEVFSAIRCAVAQMCASDKRRRHHRPQFLLSWIDHHVLGESERAKQTLVSSLLQMRNSTKQLASFYKTDFEAPGKHYIYLEKYLALYVETLVATFDISGVQLLLRKLGRSSDSLYNPVALQCQAVAAELNILQRMALNLNCPKFVVDGAGKEHIILQGNLDGSELAQIYSITRHCRLHRFYFNHARDILRDNISFFMAQREITRGILSAGSLAGSDTEASAEPMRAETGQIQQALDEYLAVADKSIVLFEHLLDQKRKLSEEPEALHRLNDCLADVYMLVLSVYGQRVRVVQQPPISAQQDMDEALVSLRNIAMLLAPSQSPPLRTEGTFWHNIIFDEMRHEPSQQYRLLDSLLEFQVNKLLDAVREASQPKPNAFSERPQLETAQPAAQSRQSEEMPMSFAQPQALPTHLRQPP